MMTEREYSKHAGVVCPSCGSSDLDVTNLNFPDGLYITQDVGCLDCGCRWRDVYKLVGYSELRDAAGKKLAIPKEPKKQKQAKKPRRQKRR